MAPKTISCKAWFTPVEYPSRESKHELNEFEDNMFNPVFKTWFRDRNIRGGVQLHNRYNLVSEILNMCGKINNNGHTAMVSLWKQRDYLTIMMKTRYQGISMRDI